MTLHRRKTRCSVFKCLLWATLVAVVVFTVATLSSSRWGVQRMTAEPGAEHEPQTQHEPQPQHELQGSAPLTYTTTTPTKKKVMAYECINGCGGWADRQKGIVDAYVLSTLMDRDFKLLMANPCPLTNFLLPNKVAWTVTAADLGQPGTERIRTMDSDARTYYQNLNFVEDLNTKFTAPVTVMTSNMEGVQFMRHHPMTSKVTWMKEKSVPEIYRQALTDLFQPSSGVQEQVKAVRSALPAGKQLVCAHMRVGRAAISNDVRDFHKLEDFPVLATFLAKYNNSQHYRLLVTSDSQKVIDMVHSQFPGIVLPTVAGSIVHTDKSSGDGACDGFKKALSEQLLLSTCDVLVVSESGFSKVAAFMRGRDDDLFIFKDTVRPWLREQAYLNDTEW